MYTYNPAGELRQHLEVCFELSFSLWVLTKCSCVADTFLFQIDAHVGGVNDIAFAHPNKQLCIVTCGDDKTIKVRIFNSVEVLCCFFNVLMDHVLQVWDAVAGRRLYMFEGHEAPVYSVCPHYKENIQVSLVLLALFLLCRVHYWEVSSYYLICHKFHQLGTNFIFYLQFIFSTAIDGKIKAWLYDCLGSRVDYDAPGRWCTTMAYSADGTR